MDFQIFAKVPVPPQKRGPGFAQRESKYPFDKLDVDDVLVIPGTTSKNFGPTVRAAEQRLSGFYFTVRTGPISIAVKDDAGNDTSEMVEVVPAGAVGVWRVAGKAPRKPQKERTAEEKAAASAKAKATRAANQAAKAAAAAATATAAG